MSNSKRSVVATKNPILQDGVPVGISIDFADGHNVSLMFDDVPESVRPFAMFNGYSQKLGDSYSGAKGDINAAYAECSSVAEALLNGDWNRRGDGLGGAYLIAAAAEVARTTEDAVREKFGTLTDDERKAIAARPDVKAVIARMKAEAALKRAEADEAEAPDLAELFMA